MTAFIVTIIVLNVLLIIGVLYRLGKRVHQLDYIKENYPAYLRKNAKGYLEYSVDHKDWSPVLQFCRSMKYYDPKVGSYIGPGVAYIQVTPENTKGLEEKFNTVQKIWSNNKLVLSEYHTAINEWIEENEQKDKI